MSTPYRTLNAESTPALQCARCERPLEPGTAQIGYLGSVFPVELLRCPGCGQVFVPEDLALGKMADVEKLLEDK